ncbi:TetR family transcriptional regulator, partial [Staphylococcus aureus]
MTAVTFDSVAAAAGITRAGIIYHFPSRDDLIA